jgi:hypothetical protein
MYRFCNARLLHYAHHQWWPPSRRLVRFSLYRCLVVYRVCSGCSRRVFTFGAKTDSGKEKECARLYLKDERELARRLKKV